MPFTQPLHDGIFPLTPRELEVLHLVSRGHQTSALAKTLGIAPRTVTTHVANALEKLGAQTRAQAVALAYEGGLLPLRNDTRLQGGGAAA